MKLEDSVENFNTNSSSDVRKIRQSNQKVHTEAKASYLAARFGQIAKILHGCYKYKNQLEQ